jgi:hypothetical protein
MSPKEHDVVKTKDGREGTIVMEFTQPNHAYLIEYTDATDDEFPGVVIMPDDIVEITWSFPNRK